MSVIAKPHERILRAKHDRSGQSPLLKEIIAHYENFVASVERLNSEKEDESEKKVELLNQYKDYIDEISVSNFKLQDKISSSVIEEFLFFLFKDVPEIRSNLSNELIFLGQASAYMDLSFAPKNFQDFVQNAGIHVSKKNQDFTISKLVRCMFSTNGKEERVEFSVPAVAIECKTFIPSTMLGQSDYEAQKIKQGNPFSLYLIVAEQNALSENVMLKNSKIDEIFILRKQKRSKIKKPIDSAVVRDLYSLVKEYLRKDWFNNEQATQKGKLIHR